MMLALVVLCYS